jgi:hypothetical protein
MNDSNNAAPNNSFNASGISLIFIVNLAVSQLIPAALIRALDTLRINKRDEHRVTKPEKKAQR